MLGDKLAELAKVNPQLVEKFDLSCLEARDGEGLLEDCPQFVDKCDKWNEMNFGRLLHFQPQLVKYCDTNDLDGSGWAALLGQKPEYADKCDWSKIDGRHWASLLRKQPQFADKCDVSKLDDRDIERLLR